MRLKILGRDVPNHWESDGVMYLSYDEIMIEPEMVEECYHFMQEALSNAQGILIHSVRGQSRSCAVVAACIMKKYIAIRISLLSVFRVGNHGCLRVLYHD